MKSNPIKGFPLGWLLVSLSFFLTGSILSRQYEPGVAVESVMVAGNVPALHFFSAQSRSKQDLFSTRGEAAWPGSPSMSIASTGAVEIQAGSSSSPKPLLPDRLEGTSPRSVEVHPALRRELKVLLGHGVTASKETLVCFAEALAAAGFDCLAVDFSGHGASDRRFIWADNASILGSAARDFGQPDVFLGHSMGAYAGAEAVRRGLIAPRLFVAVGANARLPASSARLLLLLAGGFEEAVSPDLLRERKDGQVVISPWSDHALEPYDPLLVNAVVDAACAAFNRPFPTLSGRWVWRLCGLSFGMMGTIGLAWWFNALLASFPWLRGIVVPALVHAGFTLLGSPWLSAWPVWRRFPQQLLLAGFLFLLATLLQTFRLPRWSLPVLMMLIAGGAMVGGKFFPALFAGITTFLLAWGAILGTMVEHPHGSTSAGNLAMSLFVGYAIGQWMPLAY